MNLIQEEFLNSTILKQSTTSNLELDLKNIDTSWMSSNQAKVFKVLLNKENRNKSINSICKLSGIKSYRIWQSLIEDSRFLNLLKKIEVRVVTTHLNGVDVSWMTPSQYIFFKILCIEENKKLYYKDLCKLAGYEYHAWLLAKKDKRFVEALELIGVNIGVDIVGRNNCPSHSEVKYIRNKKEREEYLKSDIWDMRKLYKEYTRHSSPSTFIVRFNKIENIEIRQIIKKYFKYMIGNWAPSTFQNALKCMSIFFNTMNREFPNINSFYELDREEHIEVTLISMTGISDKQRNYSITYVKNMFDYMYINKWKCAPKELKLLNKYDKSKIEETIPKPIPSDIQGQLDNYIENTIIPILENKKEMPISSPEIWDMIIILRYTGIRISDVLHLLADDNKERQCLKYDDDEEPILYRDHRISKNKKDLSISISHAKDSRGTNIVEDAILRQMKRVEELPPAPDGYKYLFREIKINSNQDSIISNNSDFKVDCMEYQYLIKEFKKICKYIKLNSIDGKTYIINPHQFRHTVATEMIDAGISIYAVKEFLGHSNIRTTELYIKVYQKSIKNKLKEKEKKLGILNNDLDISEELYDSKWVKKKINKVIGTLEQGDGCCEHEYNMPLCPNMKCKICLKKKIYPRHITAVKDNIECYTVQKDMANKLGLLDKEDEYNEIVKFYQKALEIISNGDVFVAAKHFYT